MKKPKEDRFRKLHATVVDITAFTTLLIGSGGFINHEIRQNFSSGSTASVADKLK